MRVMSAGDGYKYLLRTVAAGDGDRSLSTPLTRYGPDPWKVDADNGSTGSEPSEMTLKWTGHTVCLACDLSFGMVPIPYRDPVLRS